MTNETLKDRKYYLELPYTLILRRDAGDWIARVEELEGCLSHGGTKEEALSNLEEMKEAWIDDALEAGDLIPEPSDDRELPSGKWLQRVPRSLHKKLTALAKKEGVSLNQFATAILAEAAGKRSRPMVAEHPRAYYRGEFVERSRSRWWYLPIEEADWKINQPETVSNMSLLVGLKHIAAIPSNLKPEEDARKNKKELAYQA